MNQEVNGMSKKWKRILWSVGPLLVLMIILTASAPKPSEPGQTSGKTADGTTTAAYKADPNLNAPGVMPICKKKVSLKIGVAQNPNVIDWETNFQTKLIEERANFDLSFEIFPSTEFKQKITLMIAAGGKDLPDVILINPGDMSVFEWGQSGYILPLNQYYENSSFHLKEAVTRTGVNFVPMVTSPDGKIYCIPAFNQSPYNETVAKLTINRTWIDKLGLKKPARAEDLYTVLKAFKEKDPNGNRVADEIPLMYCSKSYDWFSYLMCPFQFLSCDITNGWVVKNGVVRPYYSSDAYREGLRYIHRLAAEGLLSPLTFTQDEAQFMTIMNGDPSVIGSSIDIARTQYKDPMRQYDYELLEPLLAADGSQPTPYQPSVANPAMIISSNCKSPEAAFRLGDLLVSEELSILTRFGEKGVDWVAPEAGGKGAFEAAGYGPTLKAILPWGKPQNKIWAQAGPFIRQYGIAIGLVVAAPTTDQSLIAKTAVSDGIFATKYFRNSPKEMVSKLIFTKEESSVVNEIITNLNTYKNECIASFITGRKDIEKDWANYLAELKTIGLDKALPIVQKAYDRIK
jgi:putative aldouronate transport system substrate-binding protein